MDILVGYVQLEFLYLTGTGDKNA